MTSTITAPPLDLAIFPCQPANKRPYTMRGFHDATRDPAVIRCWERQYGTCLWGAAIPDGLFVLDVDPRHGGRASLARLEHRHGRLPATLTSRTRSGGRHYWYTVAGTVRQSQGDLAPGLDTRVAGKGYVICPGVSPGWEWVDTRPPAPAPAWLPLLLRPRPAVRSTTDAPLPPAGSTRRARYGQAALAAECGEVAATPIGQGVRNVRLHRAACRLGQLVADGTLNRDDVEAALLAASTLPDHEARATIRSGLDWGQTNPRAS